MASFAANMIVAYHSQITAVYFIDHGAFDFCGRMNNHFPINADNTLHDLGDKSQVMGHKQNGHAFRVGMGGF